MGTWGEGPLDNDTAGDLAVFWDDVVVPQRSRDPEFWSESRIADLFGVLYFRNYTVHPDRPTHAEELLAVGALFLRDKLTLPGRLKALVESAINYELRPSRVDEWSEPKKRRAALQELLRDIGGKRLRLPRRAPHASNDEIAKIDKFMDRLPHWISVVKMEVKYDPSYDAEEPEFVHALKRFCFAGTMSEDNEERRRAVIARLKCLAYVTGWMLNLPSPEIERLVDAAPHAQHPKGPQYAWPAEIWSS